MTQESTNSQTINVSQLLTSLKNNSAEDNVNILSLTVLDLLRVLDTTQQALKDAEQVVREKRIEIKALHEVNDALRIEIDDLRLEKSWADNPDRMGS